MQWDKDAKNIWERDFQLDFSLLQLLGLPCSSPQAVPDPCWEQATAEGSQNQDATTTATGRDEGDKPPPSLLWWDQCLPSQTSLISSYPKPILQRKCSPKPCSLLILVIRSPAKPIDFYFAVNQAWNPCGFGCNYTDQVINRESHLPEPKIGEWEPRSSLRAGTKHRSDGQTRNRGSHIWVITDPRAFFVLLSTDPSHCWLQKAPAPFSSEKCAFTKS